jgi:mRNA interferase MazF
MQPGTGQGMGTRTVNRGDIFWVAPDEARGSIPAIAHPYVIVQDDVFNHSRIATVVACALSTNLGRASEPGVVLLEEGEGGLPRRSLVVASQVSSIHRRELGEYLGTLSAPRVDEVVAALRFLQASFHR